MNIVVCMKVTPKTEDVSLDPVTKTLDRSKAENEINPADKNALEAGLSLKDRVGGRVVVVSMGPPFFEPFLKTAIAMGADDAILLSDRAFGAADTYPTSLTLATAIRKLGAYDLILCGEESSDASTGQVPPGIAEWLGIPQITFVSDLQVTEGNRIRGRRTVRGGFEVVETTLPALVTIELGVNSPRFPDFRRKRWADREFKVSVWGLGDLELAEERVGKKGSRTVVTELVRATVAARRAERIEGTPEEKARKIAELIAPLIAR